MTVIDQLKERNEVTWLNPDLTHMQPGQRVGSYGFAYMKAANNRFVRFMPYIAKVFPETADRKGVIESRIFGLPDMQAYLNENGADITGRLLLKDDAHLPIAGSVKARGGIHEVLRIAETLAQKARKFRPTDNYEKLDSPEFRELFGQYTIQVGSTGNLGISIGRMAARMGFQAIVHMSADAKQWKKDLLRSEGVTVIEYDSDYTEAVAEGRAMSEDDPMSFFVDDEFSEDLFFGYSAAAMRVSVQLRNANIPVDKKHPLFLYLPCGVGGAPGGITFGFKQMYGDAVHCFFAEPVEAPCFLLGMATGERGNICVQDIGLTGRTAADGLAVGRPSGFACRMMTPLMSGAFTVTDEHMLAYRKLLEEVDGIRVEPSACAGFRGLEEIGRPGSVMEEYIKAHGLSDCMDQATHLVWATGGGLMPETETF